MPPWWAWRPDGGPQRVQAAPSRPGSEDHHEGPGTLIEDSRSPTGFGDKPDRPPGSRAPGTSRIFGTSARCHRGRKSIQWRGGALRLEARTISWPTCRPRRHRNRFQYPERRSGVVAMIATVTAASRTGTSREVLKDIEFRLCRRSFFAKAAPPHRSKANRRFGAAHREHRDSGCRSGCRVAESSCAVAGGGMADAADSKSVERKARGVRVPSRQ